MFVAMISIGSLCAVLLVVVFHVSAPFIEENKRQLLRQSMLSLFPGMQRYKTLETDSETDSKPADTSLVYRLFNAKGQSMAFVIKAAGMGYQDSIEFLYGYDPNKKTLSGYVVLSSRETPGLGTKIETDEDFVSQFNNLQVSFNQDETKLEHPISIAPRGREKKSWQIDTISGATVSSRSLIKTLSLSSQYWLPKLQRLESKNTSSKHNIDSTKQAEKTSE